MDRLFAYVDGFPVEWQEYILEVLSVEQERNSPPEWVAQASEA